MAHFLQVRVQSFLSYTSVAVQVLWRAGNKSRYTRFYRKQVRELALSGAKGPGLSPDTKLSWVQEQVAKLVANLLILSVLGGRSNYFVLVIVCLLGDCHKF